MPKHLRAYVLTELTFPTHPAPITLQLSLTLSTPTTSLPIALIFGAGARVGAATTRTFLAANYRTARVSRSQDPSQDTPTLLNIPADLSRPESVEQVFATVREKWGEPSVVIYNAYGSHATDMTNPSDTFNMPTATLANTQALNTISAFVAMRETLTSFQSPTAANSGPKTFIFTGNALNQGPFPGFLALGAGKAGAAYMVECADAIFGKGENGSENDVRFFYADERHEDGTPLFTGLGGEGHADALLGLAERREGWRGLEWSVTFVSGNEEQGTRAKEFRRGLILPEGM